MTAEGAKEPENSRRFAADETNFNGNGMTPVHSETFGLTVWYKTAGNVKPTELSEVIVISEARDRLELLEKHLKSIHFKCEGEACIGQILIEESEKIFQKINQNIKDSQLNNSSNEKNEGTVCQHFLKGTCRFGDKCFNSHTLISGEREGNTLNEHSLSVQDLDNNNANGHLHTKTGRKKKTRNISVLEKPGKKTSMKTATDVINRIQWDKKLNPENFTVGYLDRFLGVIEKSFSSFDWEDITSVDETILAIPRHRIQYFKYLDETVWDKRKRLDCMFGSTGSGQTILDIIGNINQENNEENN